MEKHFLDRDVSRRICVCLYRIRFWTICCTDEMVDRFVGPHRHVCIRIRNDRGSSSPLEPPILQGKPHLTNHTDDTLLRRWAALQNPIFDWVKDHRVHHKYSETDADPHNAKRGFFFSHVGWLMVKRHPEYLRRQREVDLSDITADPVVMFNKKYARELYIIFCVAIPVAVPVIFWGETMLHAILTQCFIRYVVSLNFVWSTSSVAHLWGDRTYNRAINPRENSMVSLVTGGEGSHNYHHTFPWDYKASEWPYLRFNWTTLFIRGFSKIGWAYDLREPSPTLVKKVIQTIGHKSNVSSMVY
ncbi:acyl-CoA Delta-9 desaturase-like isoform X4 [Diprion similis]|uniref:acyl-CoA Delta-9 desaturase-like isoform X4 n=1 Tax=Diprion similis TaxID=362088 RepID=UPI001EF7E6DE|nr:acyl-CoA Delta-9 desaturase-like isoform X4 [Diprion similis]